MDENDPVIPVASNFLRQYAERCVRIARHCPHRQTAHELEAIGIELMEKAADIDQLLSELGEQRE